MDNKLIEKQHIIKKKQLLEIAKQLKWVLGRKS